MTRLSHSAANRYLLCGKSYQLHYVEKYRPTVMSSALLFGTAIDKATEHYALAVKANKITREQANIEALAKFCENWNHQEINGTRTDLRTCTEIVYGNNDLDLELLDKSNHELINETYGLKDFDATINSVLEAKEKLGFKKITVADKTILNHVNWLCMAKKGKLMISAFVKWFDNNVTEVIAAQKKTELETEKYTKINKDGDEIETSDSAVGFIDLVCRVKGFDKPVILDVKTSARPYDDDAVQKSVQLSGYVFAIKHEYEDTNLAGYIVLQKNIKKNKTKICSVCGNDGTGGSHKLCAAEKQDGVIEKGKNKGEPKMVRCNGEWNVEIDPECVVQYLVGEIPELLQERVVENYEPIAKGIEAGIFPRNFDSCIRFNGAIKCDFYSICHSNEVGDLVKKDEQNKLQEAINDFVTLDKGTQGK